MKKSTLFLFSFLFSTTLLIAQGADNQETLNLNGLLTAPETSWEGDQSGTMIGEGVYATYENSFAVGNFQLSNTFAPAWGIAGGFCYTNKTDVTTTGYTNLSAITAKGADGDTYLTAYTGGLTAISFKNSESRKAVSLYVTNSVYAYLSMQMGDYYAKKFGGETGNDPDWFKLTIIGVDENSDETGRIETYLADFRAEDNTNDFCLKEWKYVDISALGTVSTIKFRLSSSDAGNYGMNTPAYFSLDKLIVEKLATNSVSSNANQPLTAYYSNGALHVNHLLGGVVKIYNLTGIEVGQFRANEENHTELLNLQKGVYVIQMQKGLQTVSQKIVIQ